MKIVCEMELRAFEFWSGAVSRARMLSWSQLDAIEEQLEELYPDGMTDTELNDLFWFDDDFIATLIGFDDWEDFERSLEDDEEEEDE